MEVVLKTENSALIATLLKSATVNTSVTLALLTGNINILNYSFAIVAFVALDLVAAPASQAYIC